MRDQVILSLFLAEYQSFITFFTENLQRKLLTQDLTSNAINTKVNSDLVNKYSHKFK